MSSSPPLVAELEARLHGAAAAEQPAVALELGWHLRHREPERARRFVEIARSDPSLAEFAAIVSAAVEWRLDSDKAPVRLGQPPTDPEWRARWALVQSNSDLLDSGKDRDAIASMVQAALGQAELHPLDTAILHNQMGRVLYQQRKPVEALPWFQGARDLAAALEDPNAEGVGCINVGNILDDLGDAVGALEAYERALALLNGPGSEHNIALVHFNIAEVRHRMGDVEDARRYAALADRGWEQASAPRLRVHALGLLARAAVASGTLDEALARVDDGLRVAEQIEDEGWMAIFRSYRATALLEAGRLDEALAALEPPPSETTLPWLVDEYELGLAAVLAAHGRHEEVVAILDSPSHREPRWFDGAHQHVIDLFVRSYQALGRTDEALELVHNRLRYVEERARTLTRTRALTRVQDVELASARAMVKRSEEVERSLQAQLRQAQRLEAVGQLASGVAHDFNNLLTVILGEADTLAYTPGLPAAAVSSAETICAAAESAGRLTRQLLAFAKKAPMAAAPTDLAAVVRSVAPIVDSATGSRVQVSVSVPPTPLPLVHGDPALLEQVILNLALNARDAMPDGGALTIEARPRGGNSADLVVWDTGVGMPPAVVERIFDPFFTTKGPGAGSGLGLAMVWGVVQQLGGSVRVQSEVGQGTRFVVELAASDQANREADATVG